MKNKNIEVEIDYLKGECTIKGVYNGKRISKKVDINGYIKNGYTYKIRHYSRRTVEDIRNVMRDQLDYEARDLDYSERLLKSVDPLVYISLMKLDEENKTSYALDYLKSMVRIRDNIKFSKEENKVYKEKCQEAREVELNKAGIKKITYNVGLFNTDEENKHISNKLKIWDKITGIRFARMQKNMIGAKKVDLKESLIMKSKKVSNRRTNIEDTDEIIYRKEESKSNTSEEAKTKKNNENEAVKRIDELIEEYKAERDMSYTTRIMKEAKKVHQHWIRKIKDERDSIRNKKSNVNRIRKVLATVTVAALSIGSVYSVSYLNNHSSDYTVPVTGFTSDTKISESVAYNNADFSTNFDSLNNLKSDTESNVDKQKDEVSTYIEDKQENVEIKNENNNIIDSTEIENNVKEEEDDSTKKDANKDTTIVIDEIKREELKKSAIEMIEKRLFVGADKSDFGDILDNEDYYADPDGTAGLLPGNFEGYTNFTVERISINGGVESVFDNGKSVYDILQENPDIERWSIHFNNKGDGTGPLGFVTSKQIEQIGEELADSVIQKHINKTQNSNSTNSQSNEKTPEDELEDMLR